VALKICLVLSRSTLEDDLNLYLTYQNYVDLVEVRADKLHESERARLGEWPLLKKIPSILTLRVVEDGGDFRGSIDDRIRFFEERLDEGWDWWDLEENLELPKNLVSEYRKKQGKVLRSFHDFSGIPSDALERAQRMASQADAVKVAVMVQNSAQLLELFFLAQDLRKIPHVVLGMGEYGVPSRILGAALGSLWTYASGEQTNNLGQLNPKTLRQVYHIEGWEADQPVFGVVGNPISHSKSPLIHNHGFEQVGFTGIYVPFLADHLEDILVLDEMLNLRGLSITLPHKEKAVELSYFADEASRSAKAANTLLNTPKGWIAHNTDVVGFIKPLLRFWKVEQLHDKRITVIGSGGAARGVIWALLNVGAKVLILGRTPSKVESLAREFGLEWAILQPDSIEKITQFNHAIIQTSSAGMGEQIGVDPFEFYPWNGTELAYDIIYNPRQTQFLKRAQQAGCPTLSGWEMFVEQAREQFELFTGEELPLDGRALEQLDWV